MPPPSWAPPTLHAPPLEYKGGTIHFQKTEDSAWVAGLVGAKFTTIFFPSGGYLDAPMEYLFQAAIHRDGDRINGVLVLLEKKK